MGDYMGTTNVNYYFEDEKDVASFIILGSIYLYVAWILGRWFDYIYASMLEENHRKELAKKLNITAEKSKINNPYN